MGFSSAKRAVLAALAVGNVQHEVRAVLEEPEGTAVFISVHRQER